MKTIVLGDIHGRTCWKEILEKEQPDKVVCLGDYVSTHEGISSEQQIDNLLEIISLKEKEPEKFVLLRGNHDIQHLGYHWAECSGLDRGVLRFMYRPEFVQRFLSATQWLYETSAGNQKILCSHAGVSEVWMENHGVNEVAAINDMEPSESFGFTPGSWSDYDGDSVTQPLTWIRPISLRKSAVKGYTQIVGHTPLRPEKPVSIESQNGDTIWLCDTLATKGYLVIEGDAFEPREL